MSCWRDWNERLFVVVSVQQIARARGGKEERWENQKVTMSSMDYEQKRVSLRYERGLGTGGTLVMTELGRGGYLMTEAKEKAKTSEKKT